MKIKYLPLVFVLAFGLILLFQNKVIAAPEAVVTICHANGNGSFIRIVTSENAIGGHFDNPGTPKQGHEDDILLEGDQICPGDSVSPTPTNNPTATPTVTPTNTPTPTASPTVTPTINPTVTPSIKPTVTSKPSKSPSPTKSPKPSKTPKPTSSPGPGGSGNLCTIINTVGVTQNTGNNSASQNTGGNTSILSGNTNTGIGINNSCGSNYALLGPVTKGNTNINISDNGAGSLDSVLVSNNSSVNILQ